MDNITIMNGVPTLTIISGDEFYTTSAGLAGYLNPQERNSYTWELDLYEGQSINDWNYPYRQIFYSNIVLEGLRDIAGEINQNSKSELAGRAYFHRGFALFQLSQLFCPVYQASTAGVELGLPIRLKADVNDRPARGSLEATYQQIFSDLDQAERLLPVLVAYKSRPNKKAVLALRARIYLSMGKYDEAAREAENALLVSSKLLNYNNITANIKSNSNPFPPVLPNANEEVIFQASGIGYSFFNSTLMVDSVLLKTYGENDLRKPIYFYDRGNGVINLKGQYAGTSGSFFGLANDELFLTLAESAARAGDYNLAMKYLNELLETRFKTGSFQRFQVTQSDEALALVLLERKKSLFRRGVRWMDLRRLNLEAKTAVTLTRVINGKTYTLAPNSTRYVLPIPRDEIALGNITQNIRY